MQTIEINGRPIAIMSGSRLEIEDFAEGDIFRFDCLISKDEAGGPLWDGTGKFAPYIRDPFPEEVAVFERGFAKALAEGEADAEDRDEFLVFLVSIN